MKKKPIVNHKERFDATAEEYDKFGPIIIPKYEEILELVCEIIALKNEKKLRVLDIGSGSGHLIKKISNKFNSKCVWQDFSESFMKIAKEKLSDHKVRFVLSDLSSSNWNNRIRQKFDVIVSINTIHNLSDERKQELYKEVYEMLEPGGLFINADEIRGENDEIYFMYLNHWKNYVENEYIDKLFSSKMKGIWHKYLETRIKRFPNFGHLDVHSTLNAQMDWLEDIGFKNVECYGKNFLWAVFGGYKQ